MRARERARGGVPQHDDELVAAEARHQQVGALGPVNGSSVARQPACDGAQHRIAHRVAERVVHPLEAVEVEVDDGHGLAATRAASANSRSARLDAALPVRQAGERIEVREPLDVLGGRRVAQDVFEPPRQQRPVHRLGDEVRRARFEGEADGLGVLVARHHHDRHGGEARIVRAGAGRPRSHPCRACRRPAARWRRRVPARPRVPSVPLSKRATQARSRRRTRRAAARPRSSSSAMIARRLSSVAALMRSLADTGPAAPRGAARARPAASCSSRARGVAGDAQLLELAHIASRYTSAPTFAALDASLWQTRGRGRQIRRLEGLAQLRAAPPPSRRGTARRASG